MEGWFICTYGLNQSDVGQESKRKNMNIPDSFSIFPFQRWVVRIWILSPIETTYVIWFGTWKAFNIEAIEVSIQFSYGYSILKIHINNLYACSFKLSNSARLLYWQYGTKANTRLRFPGINPSHSDTKSFKSWKGYVWLDELITPGFLHVVTLITLAESS